LFNGIINIPEERTNFMLFKFTDDLHLGEAANTTQDRNNTKNYERRPKENTRDFAQEITPQADNIQREVLHEVNRQKQETARRVFSVTGE